MAITHCAAAPKAATEFGSVENPPVGIVVSAWASAWNGVHRLVAEEADRRQEHEEEHRQRHVEEPEAAGRVADPVRELVDLGPRELGLEELPAADPKPREHGEREDDDPHPAEPLRELPPHQQRAVDGVDVRDDAGTGRREPRHRLEQRVERTVELRVAAQDERQGAEQRRHDPRERDDEVALAEADPGGAPEAVLDPPAGGEADHGGHDERHHRLSVADRERRREERRDGEVLEQQADERQRPADVDGGAPRRRDPPLGSRQAPRPGRAHRTFSTSGTRDVSVNTITRSPAWSTSSPRGNTRGAVPHDRADHGAADRHVAEAEPDVLARRLRGDVEDLVAVALEHRHLLGARVVGEAHDLLRRDAARVDRHVDARVLVDLCRDRVVHDRDRERDAVHAGESRCVVVLRVLLHREDAGLRLADALALEEVRVDARGVVDPASRELFRHLPRAFLVGLDQAYADPLRVEHPRDRGADLAAPVHDHVLHRARAGGEERAPRACRLGRADHDDPVARRNRLAAAREGHGVAADDPEHARVGRDAGLAERRADECRVGAVEDVELDDEHLTAREDVGLARRRHADRT